MNLLLILLKKAWNWYTKWYYPCKTKLPLVLRFSLNERNNGIRLSTQTNLFQYSGSPLDIHTDHNVTTFAVLPRVINVQPRPKHNALPTMHQPLCHKCPRTNFIQDSTLLAVILLSLVKHQCLRTTGKFVNYKYVRMEHFQKLYDPNNSKLVLFLCFCHSAIWWWWWW